MRRRLRCEFLHSVYITLSCVNDVTHRKLRRLRMKNLFGHYSCHGSWVSTILRSEILRHILTRATGRCSPEAGKRHIDVRNVIWLATSNIGHDLVFDYNESRPNPEAPTAREEYVELMGLLRPRVSARLGVGPSFSLVVI